jgi:hypothetical protein
VLVLAPQSSILRRIAGPPDRYEPLPGIAELPRWIWRRTGRRVRIGVVIAFAVAVAGTAVLVPAIDATRDRRAAAEERARAAAHERHIRKLLAEQRPRHGRTAASSRDAALADLSAAIRADARERVRAGTLDGTIRRVDCEPFPRSLNPERQLARRRVRLACVAVTGVFEGGKLGHPYRALIDFETGRYAFCKIAARLDPTDDAEVKTPRACGG